MIITILILTLFGAVLTVISCIEELEILGFIVILLTITGVTFTVAIPEENPIQVNKKVIYGNNIGKIDSIYVLVNDSLINITKLEYYD